jgi:hypothetical protein
MQDPEGHMRGAGITKQARWLTYSSLDEVEEAIARPLIDEALRVAGMSHEERHAILVDRELGD